jgi:hypothetical protein
MPSTSKKQHNFMAMIANDPKKAKQLGVPQSVGKDFTEADKGKKFGASTAGRMDLQKANVKKTDHGQQNLFKKGGKIMATKKLFGGKESKTEEMREAKAIKFGKVSPADYVKGEAAEPKKMKAGGLTCTTEAKKEVKGHEKRMHGMACGGKVKKMSKGGGIEVKGKTKGRVC